MGLSLEPGRHVDESDQTLIDMRDLSIGFTGRRGNLLPVLRNIDLQIRRGESLGLVGESGSGKSTLALAAMGYLKRGLHVMQGSTHFDGGDMFALSRKELEHIRGGQIALIPQNSGQSLTPTLRIGVQVAEAIGLHSSLSENAHAKRVTELLTQVRLPEPDSIRLRYPHELSGGQQQRVAIAMALAGEPDVLLLDEPTTGLDVTTQAHILELLRDLATSSGMAMVYVSHDLGAIARVCDQVAVMYAGEIVLQGSVRHVLLDPVHPYARGLLASIPRLHDAGLPRALDGRPPGPGETGNACAFADRCTLAEDQCRQARPELQALPSGDKVRCHLYQHASTLPMSAAQSADIVESKVTAWQDLKAPSTSALALKDISITYARRTVVEQLKRRRASATPTVDDISFELKKGETLGLVGESGSGKSTILKSIAGLLSPEAGAITWHDGDELPATVDKRTADQLRRIQIVFQNPDESLNPRQSVAEILAQPLKLYFGLTGDELRVRSHALLERVRLSAQYMERLPSQLSGGEKQRVAIARAFAAEPELVLCDEVTSALDVSVQAAVLDLLDELRRGSDISYVFVSHDLAVVRALADRVAVLYQGRLCEIGSAGAVYSMPSHPYTDVLLGAVLEPDPDTEPTLIADDVVELSPPATGCPFQRRCPKSLGAICDNETPPWRERSVGHNFRCHIDVADRS